MEKWVGAQELGFEGRGHPVSAVGMEQRLEELRAGAHRVVTGQLSCSKEVARGEGMWSPEGPLPPQATAGRCLGCAGARDVSRGHPSDVGINGMAGLSHQEHKLG